MSFTTQGEMHDMFKWNDSLKTGYEAVDMQHMELLDRLDKLVIAMREGKGKTEINTTVDFLAEYVVKHFNDEEKIQLDNNYPKYNEQKAQHEEFKRKLAGFREKLNQEGANIHLVVTVEREMAAWVRNHIMTLDKDLGQFLTSVSKH